MLRTLRFASMLFAVTSAGCLQPGGPAADTPPSPDAAADAPTAAVDVTAPPCSLGGGSRLRVAVSLAPALTERAADVWLAVRCGEASQPLRLVRWDGSPTQTLDGFGPGTYRVLGVSLLAQGAWSTPATVDGVSTAAVSLTLAAESSLVAAVNSAGPAGGDAGVVDAGTGTGGAAGEWQARVPLRDITGAAGAGSLQVFARRVDDTTLELGASLQNLCPTSQCPALPLLSLEARTLERDAPAGVGVTGFEVPMVAYGQVSRAVPVRIRGRLPDATHALQVAVFAAIPPASRAARPSARP